MTDACVLLERHRPRLVYDSHEAYFADSAAVWTDAPRNVLRRRDGTVLAKPPLLSLAFLGPNAYTNGRPATDTDVIGDTTKTYAANAAALHRQAKYKDRVYGHARRDGQNRLWLQYWLFYYYNDFQLLGPFGAGRHEGDWELVQLRLNASEQPDVAVYSQHRTAESKPWASVRKSGPSTPLVHVARGSHANYFSAGLHATEAWFDQADGKGPQITPKLEVLDHATPWMHWPGRWGDTRSTGSPLDSNSPDSPGTRAHWDDPSLLVATTPKAAPAAPPPPASSARRAGPNVIVTYDAPAAATTLVIATRKAGRDEPAETQAFALDHHSGEVEIPAPPGVDVWASVVLPDGNASAGTKAG